jgi:eukaryotic-like serine/threonine-protein kinase
MIGHIIAGRYKITEPLDAGGMGETYIAIDTQFPNEPHCVVKRLLPASKDPDFLVIMQRLFRSEAATLARVGEHDQIPRLLAYPEENQEFYLVQEYIEGHTLSTELRQLWSESQVLSFLTEILGVLEFLQSRDPKVIHRDIKPANIIRRSKDGKLVLIDFGAVKEWQAQQLTQLGKPSIMIGTPEYMPAEQFMGKPRLSSDLYAVGMIAIQALTELMPSALEEDEDGEAVWRSKTLISDWLADFLTKMVRRDFKARYQTAAEASQALQDLMRRAATVVTPRPANPQKLERVSTLPSTMIPSRSKRFKFETVSVNDQGNITERKTGEAEFLTEDLGNDVVLDMVAIPGGSFTMGSPESEAGRSDEEWPQRTVTIQPFYMGKYVVTQAQWQAVAKLPQARQGLKANPSSFKGANLPVEEVSWDDAVEFCMRLSKLKGKTYRLPSEAEWEYACRAGTNTPFYFGETITTELANYCGRDWRSGHSAGNYGKGPRGQDRQQTTDVGVFPPNGFGLYDMHGNVCEWCTDHWHLNYQGAPSDGSAWLTEEHYDQRLMRGGSWKFTPNGCRSACRCDWSPHNRDPDIGFRVICDSPRTL